MLLQPCFINLVTFLLYHDCSKCGASGVRNVARTFKGGGGSPADTNNYDRFDVPIALNTREV